jgi:hypothetical protein
MFGLGLLSKSAPCCPSSRKGSMSGIECARCQLLPPNGTAGWPVRETTFSPGAPLGLSSGLTFSEDAAHQRTQLFDPAEDG